MKRVSCNRFTMTTLVALAVIAAPGAAQTSSQQDALKAATDRMHAIQAATGVKPKQGNPPPGDPCTAIALSTVQSALPAAKAGENTHRLDFLDTNECIWKDGQGNALLILKESLDRVPSAKEGAAGTAEEYVGEKAAKNVRIETFPSLGVDNAAFAEPADAARGIKNVAAYLEVRKGRHNLTLAAPGFAGLGRAQMLKAFEAMGKQAAGRL